MAGLLLKNIDKIYPNGVQAVFNFNLDIQDKEFIVLVGPSGCGKSTTLRMIAGLEEISGGELYIDGKLMNNVIPKERDIAMVFQNYALYPHMTVYDNMAFSLKLRKVPAEIIHQKVKAAAQILGLNDYLTRKPKALSGGQRQALTLLMATLKKPKLLLLDEHTAALDPKTAEKVLTLTDKIVSRDKLTTLMITHNMRDALRFGNRLIMLHNGRVIIDVEGEEKANLEIPDLLRMFEKASGDVMANDRMLLG